ncbi:hypothetical protein QP185_16805 [Sphingomonas aerolata]|uniref:hypothetical protein n=1 Tax=Sphingomonas aerolata TaxID=185951 RepID=UPI002FDFA967
MKRSVFTTLLLGTALVGLTPGAAFGQTAREAELEARLKALEAAVQDLRGELTAARATAAAAPTVSPQTAVAASQVTAPAASPGGSPGGSPGATNVAQAKPVATNSAPTDGFRMGNTTVKLGGFVRLNAIASRYSGGEVAVGGWARSSSCRSRFRSAAGSPARTCCSPRARPACSSARQPR